MFESQDRSGTSRLFIAWNAPESWQVDIKDLIQEFDGVQGVRAVNPDQMHCTILFVGEVPTAEVDQTANAFSGISGHNFLCSPCKAVAFPTSNEPRVLALELASAPDSQFLELHREAEKCMTGFRVKRDRRKFRPHLTVARCKESAKIHVRDWQNRNLPFFPAEYLTHLTLYRSMTTNLGATYEQIAMHTLA